MSVTPASLFLIHRETGQRYPIKGEVIIGRRRGDLVFAQDTKLSMSHCRLRLTPAGVTIEDLESSGGTYVNGRAIAAGQAVILLPKDELAVGEQVFQFQSVAVAKRVTRKPRKKNAHRSAARTRTRTRKQGPEQLAAHLLILINLGVFIWQVFHGSPWLQSTPGQMLAAGASSNVLTLGNGQTWRLTSAMFLHYGALALVCNMWALYLLAKPIASEMGGRSLLLLYLASGFGAGLLGLALNPATLVSAGAFGAVAGLGGAWIALYILERIRLSDATLPVAIAMAGVLANALGYGPGPMDTFTLVGGFATGFATLFILEAMRAERAFFQEILASIVCAMIGFGVFKLVPIKNPMPSEMSEERVTTPFEIVEAEMSKATAAYENLGRQFSSQQIDERKMIEVIRQQLQPDFIRVQAKLSVLKPQGEVERRKIDLSQRLVTALLEQVTAMSKFNASKDPKYNEDIEKWSAEIEKLSAERKQQNQPRTPASR